MYIAPLKPSAYGAPIATSVQTKTNIQKKFDVRN
jgi:hypothetical protein